MEAHLLIYLVILPVALTALVRGSGAFVSGAQSLGLSFSIKPFVIGVFIVGLGTSLPELASSLAALWLDQEQIIIANVVGSNITNILLIGGILALVAGPIYVRQDLLNTELPIFAIATIHFILVISDGVIDKVEAVLLVVSLIAYGWYLLFSKNIHFDDSITADEIPKYSIYDAVTLIMAGALITVIGAHYTVSSLLVIADTLAVPVNVLSILAIAIGTSLPELAVSLQAVYADQTELAIGNLFGSNVFNMLLVTGVPAVIDTLTVAPVVEELGIMIMLGASIIFFIHGLSRRFMPWEGLLLLLFYSFFLIKLLSFV